MPAYKFDILYSLSDQGWKETYYWSGAGPFSDFVEDATALTQARWQFMHKNVQIDKYPFKAIVETGPYARGDLGVLIKKGQGVADVGSDAKPWLVLLCRATSGDRQYSRPLFLRGMPRPWWGYRINSLLPDLDPPADAAFQPLRRALLGAQYPGGGGLVNKGQWCIYGLDRNEGTNPTYSILSITKTGARSPFTITYDPPTGFGIGDSFYVTGVKGEGTAGINGRAVVIGTPATGQVEINRLSKDACPIKYEAGGTFRELIKVLVPIVLFDAERSVKRDTGGPIGRTRGARRKTLAT